MMTSVTAVSAMHQSAADPDTAALPDASGRIVFGDVWPEIDEGRYPAKATVGDLVDIECDILTDGHDQVRAVVLSRGPSEESILHITPMEPLGNDRWRARIRVLEVGLHSFVIEAWRSPFATWTAHAKARHQVGEDLGVEFGVARELIATAAEASASAETQNAFRDLLVDFDKAAASGAPAVLDLVQSDRARSLFNAAGPRQHLARYERDLTIRVERRAAAFSAWYELTPRSQSGDINRHGTFADVIDRLPYVRDLGFDVLYLTPIHPIGTNNRKGRNNSLVAEPGDPGSPYAIGSAEGGHDAIHPELGTIEDFRSLVSEARRHGLEIALDFAIQCSPDHPWIKTHPEWFDWRPDGSIRFAENPPKKYEDIVNVHFYDDAFPSLWYALRDVVLHWVREGVRIFRVDNPHTKPFPFWEWLIRTVQAEYPDVIFLSEAFTRPKIMRHLAKIGFTQSYSYFTWRNTKQELADYVTELTKGPSRAYMRPNFFANTPDINPFFLQTGGRAAHRVRLVLAASLAGNYGVYSGFELCEAEPLPGKEEYANSEKYELKAWDWDRPGNIRDDIRFINGLRRSSPALQIFENTKFYNAWNDNILYYGKATEDLSDFLLFAINLDPHNAQECNFEVPLWEFGLPDHATIDVEHVLSGDRFSWTGKIQHMRLDPETLPYVVWRLRPLGRDQ